MKNLTLEEAKARLRIPDLWRHFNLPGEPRKSCKSPFRQDSKPSFSVNDAGTLWNDFGTGEGGDVMDFFQRASRLSQRDACREFIGIAAAHIGGVPKTLPSRARRVDAKPKPLLPDFRLGRADELNHLGRLRNIPREGLEWASERGLLLFGALKNLPAWVVTDCARVNAQARRMDGQEWEHIGAKAWTLPGSWASWPIGITEAKGFPAVALCEGGPDFLAAHYLALWAQATHYTQRDARCSPVGMLGASQRIHADALSMFAGKRVRIFGHDDAAGRAAVERWAAQLASVGADVDAFRFAGLRQLNGKPVRDLNDSLLMDAESFARVERMVP